MLKKIFAITAFCILLLPTSTHLVAKLEFEVDLSSRAIWRGVDLFSLQDNNNMPALQPSITYIFGKSGFSLQLYLALSLNEKNWRSLDEMDLTATYHFVPFKKLACSLGFIHYGWYFEERFTFRENTALELYFSAGMPEIPLHPNVTFYYHINKKDEPRGWYATAQAGHGFRISSSADMELSAALGYNHHNYLISGYSTVSGFNDLELKVSFPIKGNTIAVTPYMKVVFILEDSVNPGVKRETCFGISMAF